MELEDLKILITVVEEGTTTRAARVLSMTQPGVSKHIARLERDVGGDLFRREGKYLKLNEFGEFFFERAKRIVNEVEELSNMPHNSKNEIGSLRLGLTDAATLIVTPPTLVTFRSRYPGVHITLDVDSSAHIEEKVLHGDCDMGFVTADSQPHREFECEMLYEDVIDPIVAVNHPLARKRNVTLEELAHHTLIMSPARRRTRRIIEDAFTTAGVSPRNVIDVYVHTAAARLAESGLGVALLPRSFIAQDIPRRRFFHLRIVGDPIRRTLCMVRRKDVEVSETVRCFYELMLQYKDSLGTTRLCSS